jgi:hypothetical protein
VLSLLHFYFRDNRDILVAAQIDNLPIDGPAAS